MNILERETEAWLACAGHFQSKVNKPHLRIGRARPAGESASHDKNMSTTILDLPAHPIPFAVNEGQIAVADMYINGGSGQSLRAHAAIALKVPRSGCPELDEMILESRRMDYAGLALQGLCASQWGGLQEVPTFVQRAREMADSMIGGAE